MSLAVIVLNYRTPDLTAQCLRSLAPCLDEGGPGSRLLLVDNASGDDSVTLLRRVLKDTGLSARTTLIESGANLGFARGNNLALARLHDVDTHVLLLNSDTIVRPGAIARCVQLLGARPEIGVVSCRLDNADGSPQANARRLPTPSRMTAQVFGLPYSFPRAFAWADLEDRTWDRLAECREVEWVGGAFMLIRGELLREVGGLDSGFFFYGEDAEFCHRVRRAGRRVWYEGSVSIVHLGGGSSDPVRLAAKVRDRCHWEARYLLQRRCYGRLAERYLRTLDVAVYAARCIKLRLTPSRVDDYRAHREILGLLRALNHLPGGS
jgi:GT2 family glycosyltransferase